MNKFNPQTGGHPLKLDDLILMQSSYFDGFKAVVSAMSSNGNCILKGVFVTIGSSVAYTDGFIAIGGEIFKVVAGTFLTSSNPSDVLYFNPAEVAVPPDPTKYKDNSVNNVHLQRTAVLKYKESGDTLGVNYVDCLRNDAGDMIDWLPPPGTVVSSFFDNTGLGIGVKEGWAICNGLNGTIDYRGTYTAMATNVPATGAPALDASLNGITSDIIDRAGQNKITLAQSEIPIYDLSITDPGHVHHITGSDAAGFAGGGFAAAIQFGTNPESAGNTDTATTGITVHSNGGGAGHENRPPTVYVYKIMRLR